MSNGAPRETVVELQIVEKYTTGRGKYKNVEVLDKEELQALVDDAINSVGFFGRAFSPDEIGAIIMHKIDDYFTQRLKEDRNK